ncbi:hypothetical protein DICPUDRAFT_77422 [Dictyostelium purpureum]|uniref:J domain-containing protein n=1 Tax=Dictyostelium purpureum TaxID=5786 RepID=F0ZGK0_DICPU|nr:uncharacterized protein DICPUDRAFT_77422 [Dictyostelium purpureum]EGC36899.1 hypothetical protein DICPUDRAFT_77422 [Dictyostelium purpureum]|eukprot:XP_003286542.1 hypothetical protein DICPUDRAFT_77422 [Dictyostelium purpureum]
MDRIDKDILKDFDDKIKANSNDDDSDSGDEKFEKQLNNIDFYAVLNIPRNASADEIKIAYKKLAFTYHPDKQADEALKKETQELFTLITMAKDILSDPKLRAIYDKFGLEGLEHSKAIVNKYKEVDTLLKALDRIKKESEEEKLIEQFSATGSQSISLGYHRDYNLFFFKTLKSESTFNIQTKKFGSFEIIPSITKKKNNYTWFGLATTYRYAVNSNSELFFTNTYEEIGGNSQTIGIKSMLTQNSYGSIYGCVENGVPRRAGVILTKTLSPTVQAVARCAVSREFHTASLLLKRVVQKRIFELSLDYHTLSGLHASITRIIPISKKSKLFVSIGGYNGLTAWNDYGATGLTISLNRRLSKVFEIDFSMQITPSRFLYVIGFHHRYQAIQIPIPIYSDSDISWKSSLLFFTVPTVAYTLVRQLVIRPLLRKKEEKKIKEKKEKYAEQARKSKRKAEMDILLVSVLVENKIKKEKTKNGLIIQEAIYGKINEKLDSSDPFSAEFPPYVDVTVPLQYLVEESKLELHSNNKKSDLLGFWDPRIGEEKQLKVTYFFQNKLHRVVVNDSDQLLIPLKSHLIQ